MKFVTCDLCGANEAKIVAEQKDIVHRSASPDQSFSLVQCASCKLVYLNPRLDDSEISKYYPDTYAFHAEKNMPAARLKAFLVRLFRVPLLNAFFSLPFHLPFLRKRFVYIVKPYVKDYAEQLKPCRFLDVGCGSGLEAHFWGGTTAVYSLQKKGFDVVGVEPSARAREIAGKHGLKVVSSIHELKGVVFDFIRINWALEHVDSPSEYFRAFSELLRPGGRLLISVPNYDGILYRLFPDCVEVPAHCFYFTPPVIEAYLKRFSFTVVDKLTFSYPAMFTFGLGTMGHKFELSPLECLSFQNILNEMDRCMLGNDMVYLCEKSSEGGG